MPKNTENEQRMVIVKHKISYAMKELERSLAELQFMGLQLETGLIKKAIRSIKQAERSL